jgi:hypothetical protein
MMSRKSGKTLKEFNTAVIVLSKKDNINYSIENLIEACIFGCLFIYTIQ